MSKTTRLTPSELVTSLARRLEQNSVRVPFSGCQIWMGVTNEHGYGLIGMGRRLLKTHRAAYLVAHGGIPEKDGYHGAVIRHTCDNPSCINPAHLTVGTQADNNGDMVKRNRNRFGSLHHAAKLTEKDIPEILAAKGKETQKSIASRYGVYPSVISRIYSGEAWSRAVQGELS
ncbi:MAG: HNH endonuclease [Caulobacteraceae bacterium]|nr:HNH endonuclease [Caulobacteraceae bacterium]